MVLDFLPPDSMTAIAWALTDSHGANALSVADRTIADLEADGEHLVADAWKGLRSIVEDALAGRLSRGHVTIH